MNIDWYILGNHGQIIKTDVATASQWLSIRENKRIAYTEIGHLFVSTVFLGLDHGMPSRGNGSPILFETMTFHQELSDIGTAGEDRSPFHEEYMEGFCRYTTRTQALLGHTEILATLETRLLKEKREKMLQLIAGGIRKLTRIPI